jgi:hypothetical protein
MRSTRRASRTSRQARARAARVRAWTRRARTRAPRAPARAPGPRARQRRVRAPIPVTRNDKHISRTHGLDEQPNGVLKSLTRVIGGFAGDDTSRGWPATFTTCTVCHRVIGVEVEPNRHRLTPCRASTHAHRVQALPCATQLCPDAFEHSSIYEVCESPRTCRWVHLGRPPRSLSLLSRRDARDRFDDRVQVRD